MTTWITIDNAVTLIGRPKRTIYEWVQNGRVRSDRSPRNTLVIDAEHLLQVEPTIVRGRPRGSARPKVTHLGAVLESIPHKPHAD